MTKKILGLDLGTNSIGWSLVEHDFESQKGKILGIGSRIIPMSQDILGEFGKGNSVSQTAERTGHRSARHIRERYLLRRERLHRILNVLGFLPEHYTNEIDFEKRLGKFFKDKEPKLAWKKNKEQQFDFIFKNSFAEMAKEFSGLKIPYDWTIYYLRKKALTQKIEKEELAWVLLNFNQKRGYYQLRGEGEEITDKKEYVEVLKVVKIEKGDVDRKNNKRTWYKISLSNGWEYSATFTSEPQWLNIEKEFLVTEEIDEDGNVKTTKDKERTEKRKITPLPSFEEINLMTKSDQDKIYKKIKAKTEITISNSNKTVGAYIYDALLKNPKQKINGKLIRTIERKFYKDELRQILKKQIELQPDLFSEDLYNDCIRELYRNNEAHQLTLSKRDFVHLILDDILFYQRPLRSQKSLIGNCTLEYRVFKVNSETKKQHIKVIPKSNPLYQEFRIWQFIKNLSIYRKDDGKNVTIEFISSDSDIESLFEFLNNRKDIEQKPLIKYLVEEREKKNQTSLKGKALSTEIEKYRWNFVEDKAYPCNETKTQIRTRLEKVINISHDFLNADIEQQLWHIIYSVNDKIEFEKALKSFAQKYKLDETSFVDNFKKFPPFKSEYGAYSEKAIKKLLPLLRIGKYWSFDNIDSKTKLRIDKIITGEFDETIKDRVREKAIRLREEKDFQNLPLWLACYIVYNKHSEASDIKKWKSIEDLENYIKEFKQHSLRNPIVEQVVTETLRVVKDIWQHYGKGVENFFDEIHIELSREMKNTADERKRLTNAITENENTNMRIKALIMELKENSDGQLAVDNVRPFSPIQQEVLKIYEEGVLNSNIEIPDDIAKISKSAQPSKTELTRYKLWLEQKYRSPYTGEIIPLNKLFTPEYEIEHIIPQSRYFDDSFNNKVICESVVNKNPYKDNQLGLEFIKKQGGRIVTELSNHNKTIKILTEEEYKNFVKEHYGKNNRKRNNLLLEEIPEKMIERQMNDTRYISKFIMTLLSNIVREDKDDDGVNSKNIIPGNGKITTQLKQDWGLNDVWNELILPRFERMNSLTNSQNFTTKNTSGKTIPVVPLELSKGFQKKRIDHRHHALDALVIACATRDHVNLLNNQSAKSDNKRYDLQNKLRNKEKWKDNNGNERDKFTTFKKPWENFTVDTKKHLEKTVVSFKQNLRVINKATNYYEKIENGKKIKVAQKGINWAIRKPMHKDTVSGKIELPRIKVPKGKILTATRKSIDTSFDLKTIESITDTGIQKILKNYLNAKENNPELAFSPEGLEVLNKNISQYNDGKAHQPIYKARIFEMGSKFSLGQTGNKKDKYVEAAKGTNLFFAIYQDDKGKRSFETIPLNIVIERQKQGLNSVPEKNEKQEDLLFHLSPNDLVYVPTEEERENSSVINFSNLTKERTNNIYKMVSSTGSECHFIRANISSLVKNYDAKSKIGELGSLNKLENTIDENPIQIKQVCLKLRIDRLGNILKA